MSLRDMTRTGLLGSVLVVTLAACAPPDDAHEGAVQSSHGALRWVSYDELSPGPDSAGFAFGSSAALGGGRALVGAPFISADAASGSAFVFARGLSGWEVEGVLSVPSLPNGSALGRAVSLSTATALVTAPLGAPSGSAHVFTLTGTGWEHQAELLGAERTPGDFFGFACAVAGDLAVIGARADSTRGTGAGAVHVFERSGASWVWQKKLHGEDTSGLDGFGNSVSLFGDTLVVGASGAVGDGGGSGAAYVFVRSGSDWVQEAKLSTEGAAEGAQFGTSVSVGEDAALIGASFFNAEPGDGGSGHVFERTGGAWSEQATLVPPGGELSATFGVSVALAGDEAAIGASGDGIWAKNGGAVYTFHRVGSTWGRGELLPVVGKVGDRLGASVALSADELLAGASLADTSASISGAAYLFVGGLEQGAPCAGGGACLSGPCTDGVCSGAGGSAGSGGGGGAGATGRAAEEDKNSYYSCRLAADSPPPRLLGSTVAGAIAMTLAILGLRRRRSLPA